jgi:hypothetical protein
MGFQGRIRKWQWKPRGRVESEAQKLNKLLRAGKASNAGPEDEKDRGTLSVIART